uniref:DDE-1 domain-containing protein n=1 Tax=Phytophthora ramorum TaxID=164328 RepID=H3H5Q8_PHYRM
MAPTIMSKAYGDGKRRKPLKETSEALEERLWEWIQKAEALNELTDLYSPEDVYNMDETRLCYAMAPARSICTKTARGVKKKKTRITLTLTAYADGSDTLPALFFEFLPPNTTAFLQPMDGGIIAAFKRAYRGKQLRWAYEKVKRGEELKKDVYTVDQLQAMQWSKEIWLELRAERDKEDTSYGTDVDLEDIII